jgi:hypothetical protein
LEKIETQTAAAHGNRRGGNLHGKGGLSRIDQILSRDRVLRDGFKVGRHQLHNIR